MKKNIILWISALLLLTAGAGCEKKSSEEESHISCPCECVEKKIPIATLKNESARIRYKKLDNHVSFVLDNKELVHEHYLILLGCDMAPQGCDIPEKYKEDGLPVIISGEVFDCSEYIKPWIKRDPVYFIKLSTIKKK